MANFSNNKVSVCTSFRLDAKCTSVFSSWHCMMSVTEDIPIMVIRGTQLHPPAVQTLCLQWAANQERVGQTKQQQ